MPFNSLILTSLHSGTSFSEARNRVSLQRRSNETILFFSTDEQSNPHCTLRQDLDIPGGVCDLVVFYAQGNRKIVCLVELKGSDLKRAVEQVTNMYENLRRPLKQTHLQLIEWKVYICMSGAVPKEAKNLQKNLHRIFGKRNFVVSKNDRDFGKFLRR